MSSFVRDGIGVLGGVAVLIPAWQPEGCLVALVEALVGAGVGTVVVVDDGSGAGYSDIFGAVETLGRVRVLRHAVNLGKGRALKTGFNYVLDELPEICGVVTADADGQHTAGDIIRVARALGEAGGRVVLGARSFAGDVPLRSRFGNALTRRIFRFSTGVKVGDTQTGLRGFPRGRIAELMTLEGERYEYEMTVLLHVCREGRRPVEVPIETVYIEANRGSHFDPVWDSTRIYFVLVRFYFSSIVAAAIDFAGFTAAFALTGNVLASVAAGRLSSLVNFALNRRFVFRDREPVQGTLWKYYLLVVAVGSLSYGLIWALSRRLHWNVYAAKVAVDALLSLVSFSAQRTYVFRSQDEA